MKANLKELKKELKKSVDEVGVGNDSPRKLSDITVRLMISSREQFNLRIEEAASEAMQVLITRAIISLVFSFILMYSASLLNSKILLEFGIFFMIYIPSSLICCMFVHLYLSVNNKKLYIINIIQLASYMICGIISLYIYINSNMLRFLSFTFVYFLVGSLKIPSVLSGYKVERRIRTKFNQFDIYIGNGDSK